MLKRVTFTGIDTRTDPKALIALYKQYPFIEFGFLISEGRTGMDRGNRYPSVDMLEAIRGAGIPMAMHVCGKMAFDIFKRNDWSGVEAIAGKYMDMFSRIQINGAVIQHFHKDVSFPEGKEIIFQIHDGNEALYMHYAGRANVAPFQDNSGGVGKREGSWRAPLAGWVGYAGGITPENVVASVMEIEEVCRADYWIDMETGIRTDDWFDIEKCRSVCEQLVAIGAI